MRPDVSKATIAATECVSESTACVRNGANGELRQTGSLLHRGGRTLQGEDRACLNAAHSEAMNAGALLPLLREATPHERSLRAHCQRRTRRLLPQIRLPQVYPEPTACNRGLTLEIDAMEKVVEVIDSGEPS